MSETYYMLKKLDKYINTKRWKDEAYTRIQILSDDFFENIKYDRATSEALLSKLKENGMIDDTFLKDNISTHAVRITDKGILELKFRRKHYATIIITAIITFLGYDFLRDLIEFLLQ